MSSILNVSTTSRRKCARRRIGYSIQCWVGNKGDLECQAKPRYYPGTEGETDVHDHAKETNYCGRVLLASGPRRWFAARTRSWRGHYHATARRNARRFL